VNGKSNVGERQWVYGSIKCFCNSTYINYLATGFDWLVAEVFVSVDCLNKKVRYTINKKEEIGYDL